MGKILMIIFCLSVFIILVKVGIVFRDKVKKFINSDKFHVFSYVFEDSRGSEITIPIRYYDSNSKSNEIYFFVANESVSFPSLHVDSKCDTSKRILAIDWPGLGLTKGTNVYLSPKEKANILITLLRNLGIDKKKIIFLTYADGYEIISNALRYGLNKNHKKFHYTKKITDVIEKRNNKYILNLIEIRLLQFINMIRGEVKQSYTIFKRFLINDRMHYLVKYDVKKNKIKCFIRNKEVVVVKGYDFDSLDIKFGRISEQTLQLDNNGSTREDLVHDEGFIAFAKNNIFAFITASLSAFGIISLALKIFPDIQTLKYYNIPLYHMHTNTTLTSLSLFFSMVFVAVIICILNFVIKFSIEKESFAWIGKVIRKILLYIVLAVIIFHLLIDNDNFKAIVHTVLIIYLINYFLSFIICRTIFNDLSLIKVNNIQFCIAFLGTILNILIMLLFFYLLVTPYQNHLLSLIIKEFSTIKNSWFSLSLILSVVIYLIQFFIAGIIYGMNVKLKEYSKDEKRILKYAMIASFVIVIPIYLYNYLTNVTETTLSNTFVFSTKEQLFLPKNNNEGFQYISIYQKQDTSIIVPVIVGNDSIYIFSSLFEEFDTKSLHFNTINYPNELKKVVVSDCDWEYLYRTYGNENSDKDKLQKLFESEYTDISKICELKEK
ncbi:hypothetical protein [Amedibacillus sp. YH-ame10]